MKWKELPYDDCYWEFESDISAFQPEIERFNKIQSRSRKRSSSKQKSSIKDAAESRNQQKEFQQYDQSPEFPSGGTLMCLTLFSASGMLYFYALLVVSYKLIIAFLVFKVHCILTSSKD